MASALFESLLMNHPFIDGNKRVAFFASDVFLRLNGFKLSVEADAGHAFLIGLLERGECDYARQALGLESRRARARPVILVRGGTTVRNGSDLSADRS